MPEHPHMRQFLVLVFALLIPCFLVWTMLSNALAMPALGIVDFVLTHWFPDVVHALYAQGANVLLMTEFGEANGQPVPLAGSEYRLGFELNTRILSYSLPFYTALHFATQRKEYFSAYLSGLLVLYSLFTIGLLFVALKTLMVSLGSTFQEQSGVFVPNSNVIGLLYQFSVLIVPTLAPAAVWLWQSRDAPLLRAALSGYAGIAKQD